jgi:predicted cobalt transporter CbtA
METATKIYAAMAAVVFVLTASTTNWRQGKILGVAGAGTVLGLIGGLISANVVAAVMTLLDRRLAWFVPGF